MPSQRLDHFRSVPIDHLIQSIGAGRSAVSFVAMRPPLIESLFSLRARESTPGRELRGALATFLTMAYILFANPGILQAAGIPFEAAVTATAVAAAVSSVLMGLIANVPIALAPGMGLNAFVAYQIAGTTGSWQAAMGLVVVEGLAVLALVLVGLREAVMDAIPADLRRAIGAGIGLFIAFIGAVNAHLVSVPPSTLTGLTSNPLAPLPPVGAGSLTSPDALLAVGGLLLIAVLIARRQPGALLIGILATTGVALVTGLTSMPAGPWWRVPHLPTAGAADLGAALHWSAVPLILSLMMVDFFDTIGTATAIAEQAGLATSEQRIPRLKALLAVDAVSASIGGWLGASSATAYIESAAGVADGARTGLHSVAVGGLFAIAAFFAPLAAVVPASATAPALIAVGALMASSLGRIGFTDPGTGLPALLTVLFVPLTYSIAHGIGFGAISYVAIAVLRGRARRVHPLMFAIALAFAAFFALA
jgi:adenine/guanine/hypoxanthine permease